MLEKENIENNQSVLRIFENINSLEPPTHVVM